MTFGSIDNQRFYLSLRSDTSNMVVVTRGGRSFTLGPRTNPADPSGRPDTYFIPERGDELSFTVSRSVPELADAIRRLHHGSHPVVEAICLLSLSLEEAIGSQTGDALALRAGLFRGQRMDEAGNDVELPDRPCSG
jgi:hypothetical protein